MDSFLQTDEFPKIGATTGLPITWIESLVAEQPVVSLVNVNTTLPGVFALTKPIGSFGPEILAIIELLEVQVPPEEGDNCEVSSTQSDLIPLVEIVGIDLTS